MRFDNKDTIKRALAGINSTTSDPLLKTYAVGAMPYISLVGTIGNELYKTLGPDPNGEVLLAFKGTTLEANSPATNPFRLRDMVLLQYFGTDTLDQTKLWEKSGDVYYNGQPLRSGAWITFRIEKRSTRLDYFGRAWYSKFSAAIQELKKTPPNVETINQNLNEGTILLFADGDFTPSDQYGILRTTKDTIESAEALLKLGQGPKVTDAINKATVPVQKLGPSGTTIVTPVTATGITEAANPSAHQVPLAVGLQMTVSVQVLKQALQSIGVAPRF